MENGYILDGVNPVLAARMRAAINATEAQGVAVTVRSGFRDYQTQVALWNNRQNNRYPVAQPGKSPHEWGAAVDARPVIQSAANWQVLWNNAAAAGLTLGHNFHTQDNVHFELPGFAHGSDTQPGLAQYGIYSMPGSATSAGAAVPAILPVGLPAATQTQSNDLGFQINDDTITVIVLGVGVVLVMSWLSG